MSAAQQQRQMHRNQRGEYSEYERAEVDFDAATVHEDAAVVDPWDSEHIPPQRVGPDGVTNQGDLVSHRRVAYLTDKKLAAAVRKIDAINTKLAAAGTTDTFTLTPTKIVVRDGHGQLYETHQVVVDTPRIKAGEWTFAAVITPIGGQSREAITQPLPDMEGALAGWRATDAAACDHCGQSRRREKTYAIVNADGDVKQVGSSCLQPFTGVDAATMLRWLEFDAEDVTDEDDRYGAGDATARVIGVRESIAQALAFSDGGARFVTKSEAIDGPQSATATATLVSALPTLPSGTRAGVLRAAAGFMDDGTVDEVLAAAQRIDGSSDYAINLRALTAHDHVSARHLGMVTSAVKVWVRQQEEQLRAATAGPAKGWIGEKGESLKGRRIGATVVKSIPGESYYGGYSKPTTLLILQTDDGHLVKWSASSARREKVGEQVVITGGTVKDHATYNGDDQTVLVRVKIEPVQANTGEIAAEGAAE